ncbi:hypothetical protein M3J09_005361 [Ascochyta lentis]
MTLWPIIGAFLFSFAVQSSSSFCNIQIAVRHYVNQAASHYKDLSPTMQVTAIFVAAILTYRSIMWLCRRLCDALQAQLARVVSVDYVTQKELDSRKLVTRAEFGVGLSKCQAELFTKQEVLDLFVKKAELRIDELSQRLDKFITKEEAEKMLLTNEEHAASTSRQHETWRSEILAHVANSIHNTRENATLFSTHIANELHQTLIQTINDIIAQHSKDKAELDRTLSALHNTIKDHAKQLELNQATTQTLQSQHEESLALHTTICLRIRTHTGPCSLVDEMLRKRCVALAEHDLAGHVDALLEHTKDSFDKLVRLK